MADDPGDEVLRYFIEMAILEARCAQAIATNARQERPITSNRDKDNGMSYWALWSLDCSSTYLIIVSRTSACLISKKARIRRSPSSGVSMKEFPPASPRSECADWSPVPVVRGKISSPILGCHRKHNHPRSARQCVAKRPGRGKKSPGPRGQSEPWDGWTAGQSSAVPNHNTPRSRVRFIRRRQFLSICEPPECP